MIQRRARVFGKYNLPLPETLASGLVGTSSDGRAYGELERGTLCLVVSHNRVFLAKGMCRCFLFDILLID